VVTIRGDRREAARPVPPRKSSPLTSVLLVAVVVLGLIAVLLLMR
jgi:hypothetical protein